MFSRIKFPKPCSELEKDQGFPHHSFDYLRSTDVMKCCVPSGYGGQGWGSHYGNSDVLELLWEIGAYDLSVGRIFEGHVNALLLVDTYGSDDQKQRYFEEAANGVLFGVWNSEFPDDALILDAEGTDLILQGAKVFCSGAGHVDRPIVTAEGPDGRQMLILTMEDYSLKEDYRYWNPLGMKASVSCRFDFFGIAVQNHQLLGRGGDYDRQPDFTGGAVRFAAVQLGGAEAAIQETVEYLQKYGRNENPDHFRRLGQLAILRERGRVWLDRVAKAADNRVARPSQYVHYANMFRTEVRNLCEEVLKLCELSVGLKGMMAPHPLERIHRDLSLCLKQPGPHKALSDVGEFFASQHSYHETIG
ncbi:MAG TPA: acyl-CoA dehydrogenase family protein [Pricia sp.]|nr:acyl-CoA dehydrogenase family protein [Pricia sp.]